MCIGWCNNWVTQQHARCNNENKSLLCLSLCSDYLHHQHKCVCGPITLKGLGLLNNEVSRSLTHTTQGSSERGIGPSQRPVHKNIHTRHIPAQGGIRTRKYQKASGRRPTATGSGLVRLITIPMKTLPSNSYNSCFVFRTTLVGMSAWRPTLVWYS